MFDNRYHFVLFLGLKGGGHNFIRGNGRYVPKIEQKTEMFKNEICCVNDILHSFFNTVISGFLHFYM